MARRKGDEDDDDSDGGDDDDGGNVEAPPSTAPTTTVARVAAAAAALADPEQAHMLFVKGTKKNSETVRPGVLVLVNDADWELLGGPGARVGAGDRVTFISTLHGG